MKKDRTVFVHVNGWVGVWEKGVKFIDVYPASVAQRTSDVHGMIAALRTGRNHPKGACVINVEPDLTTHGTPKNYLSSSDFVKVMLSEWVREYSHLHVQAEEEMVPELVAA